MSTGNQATNTVDILLRLAGGETLDELREGAAEARVEFTDLVAGATQAEMAAYDLAESAEDAASDVYRLADAEKVAAREAAAAAAAADRAAAAAGGLDAPLRQATKGFQLNGRAGLELGRVLQDFVQGGFGGILNNLEGASRALGGGPGLAGLLTAVGVAAYVATPLVKALWKEITGGSEKVPESADRLERLDAAVKAVGDRLGELRKQQGLTNDELAEFNALTIEATRLEREQAKAKEDKATRDRAGQLRDPGVADVEKRRAETLRDFFGDPGERRRLEQEVRKGLDAGTLEDLRARQKAALAAQKKSLTEDPLDLVGVQGKLAADVAGTTAAANAEGARLDEQSKQLVADLLVKGQTAAFEKIRGMLNLSGRQRDMIEFGSADALDADDTFDAEIKQREQAVKDRDARAKEAGQEAKGRQRDEEAEARALEQDDAENLRKWRDAGRKGEAAKKKADAEAKKEHAKALKAEQDGIVAAVGETFRRQYELQSLTGADPRRLASQMENAIRARGASAEGSKAAAKSIAGKGDEDLGRRMSQAAAQGLDLNGQALYAYNSLAQEFAQLGRRVAQLQQGWQRGQRAVRQAGAGFRGSVMPIAGGN